MKVIKYSKENSKGHLVGRFSRMDLFRQLVTKDVEVNLGQILRIERHSQHRLIIEEERMIRC